MWKHLNNARLQLLHRCLLFGLHRGTHHLPLHHAVLVQGSLVLMEYALLVTLAEVLQENNTRPRITWWQENVECSLTRYSHWIKKTHSIRLQQIQEKIELFHDIVLFPSPLRTFPKQHLFVSFRSLQQSRWRDGGVGGYTCWAALSDSTANSTDRLFRDWRSAPQELWDEAQDGRQESSEPKTLWENTNIWQMDAVHFWCPERRKSVPAHTWAPCRTSEDPWRSPWSAQPFSLLCPAVCWSCCGCFWSALGSSRTEPGCRRGGIPAEKSGTTQKGSSPRGTICLFNQMRNKLWPVWRFCLSWTRLLFSYRHRAASSGRPVEKRWTRLPRCRLGLRDRAAQVLHTEPLKVRKVFSSSSSEKIGWRATKLMNLPSARLRPSMNSRSEMEVKTAERRQRNIDFSRQKIQIIIVAIETQIAKKKKTLHDLD